MARKVKTAAILTAALAVTATAYLAGWFYLFPWWQLQQAEAAAASRNTATAIGLYESIRARFPGSVFARRAIVEELKLRQAAGLEVVPLIEEAISRYGSDVDVACVLLEVLKRRYQDNLEPEIKRCYEEGSRSDKITGMVKTEAGFVRAIKEKCPAGFGLAGGDRILTAYENFLEYCTNGILARSDAIQPPTTMKEVTGTATDRVQKIVHSQVAYFPDTQTHYSILALTTEQEYPHPSYVNQFCVCQYDREAKKWRAIWKSDSFQGQSPWQPLLVVGPDKSTLLCSSYFLDGATGSISAILLAIEGDSRVTVKESGSLGHGSVELDGGTITVTEEEMGQRRYSLRGGKVVIEKVERSIARPKAVQACFTIRGNDIVPVSNSTITIKVGQTVVFVPADKKTAREFNERRTISIYTECMERSSARNM